MTLCWNGPLSRCWGSKELKTQVRDRKSYTSEKLCYFNFRKKWIWAERRRSCVALCSIQQEGSRWELKANGPMQVWLWEIMRSSRAIWDQVMRADMELGKRPFSLTLMGPSAFLALWKWTPLEAPRDVSQAKSPSYLWRSFALATGRLCSWYRSAQESQSFEEEGQKPSRKFKDKPGRQPIWVSGVTGER